MKDWDKILDDFAHKCGDGGPDMTNPRHLALLRESLIKFGWTENATNEFIGNLREGEEKDYTGKGTRTGSGTKSDPYKYDYSEPSSKTDGESEEGGDEDDGEEKTENSTTVTQEQIDEFDGDTKKGGLNKEVKAPGNDASVVNEIGVGYAVACLDSGGDVEKCLIDKFKGTKLEKNINNAETRRQILQSAKAERKRLNDHMNDDNNPLDPKTTKVAHVWGSKQSLKGAVDGLQGKGIKVVNGIPFDGSDESKLYRGKMVDGKFKPELDKDGNRIPLPVEFDKKTGKPKNYAQVILNGGGGEDPTDTIFIMTDDNGNCEILHSSNKTSTQDLQANGSPYEEINSITESAKNDIPDENGSHAKIDKLEEETASKIKKIRTEQKEYVASHVDRLGKRLEDPKNQDYIIKRLLGDENSNPRGISTTEGKYFKSILKHKKVKKAMEAKYDKDWVKALEDPNDERYMDDVMRQEVMKAYVSALQSDIEEGVEMRGDDVQIVARLFGKTTVNVVENGKVKMKKDGSGPVTKTVHGEEDMTGQKIPEGPDKFGQNELNNFYNLQTQEINNHRLKLNEIGEEQGSFGLGDYHHIQRMISRLHLNLADEHSPGGIPSDRFALNMGVLKRKGDIKKDKDGNFLSKGEDGKYYKYNEDTKRWDDGPFEGKTSELEDNDCAVMADGETHRHCLGLKEGEKLSDGFKVQYGTINASVDSQGNIVDFGGSEIASVKAIIYDRNGNQVAVQTCRPKGGPGASVNDTINWTPEYQKCMAEHSIVNGKCG